MNTKSYKEGTEAEQEFIKLRGDNFIRPATRDENIFEHWDVLDEKFGKVDVKAAKRKYRNGPIDHTIWWELKTVKRPPTNKSENGWGVPNGIDRYIAVRSPNAFYLVKPEDIIGEIEDKCKEYYRGEFGLHTRPNRGDLLTILPLDLIINKSDHVVNAEAA